MERRVRVLFVEGADDPTAVSPAELGEETPFEVERAEGVSAESFDASAYDCVVCNYALAAGDGIEVVERLCDVAPSLPVVVYTAVGDESVARDALRAGAAEYVVSGETGTETRSESDGGDGDDCGGGDDDRDDDGDEVTELARRVAAAADDPRRASEETAAQLETLTRVLTHDIRNDLSVVVGWADVLRDSVTEEGEEALDRILDNVRGTLELTDVARDAVETIAGPGAADVEPTYLPDVLRREVRTRRETFPEATVELGDVPPCRVAANSLLGSVFRTLLNEVLSGRRGDDVTVRVTAERDGDAVCVRVRDGSESESVRRETAFDRAELGSPDTTIGVFLVETLADAYGGDVWVEADGAVFAVKLRAVD